jgi:hypothetical protein
MLVGHLKEIWRYPVKSRGGETLASAQLNPQGIPGDRCWAVVDSETNEIRSAKRWPALLNHRAKLEPGADVGEGDYGDALPDLEIVFPDGQSMRARDANVAEKLSNSLGHKARLSPLAPPGDLDHYRLARARTPEALEKELQLQPGESIAELVATATPEMLKVLKIVSTFATPPGTYFDALPLHLLTTASLSYLRDQAGVDAVVQRYRPNLLIEPVATTSGMVENDWLGKCIQIGEVVVAVHSRTVRCAMPSREQVWCDVREERGMARAMVKHCDRHFGVYARIERTGEVSAGDEVHLVDE